MLLLWSHWSVFPFSRYFNPTKCRNVCFLLGFCRRSLIFESVQDENVVVPSLRISKQAVSFFNKTALKEMVRKNVLFHLQGGNLKSVQLLKDNSIDTTLQKQRIKFIPEGSSEGIQELTAHLKQHYEKNYDPRGGYGRPLPGKMTPSPVLCENRWFDVIEPREGRHRWDAALGPIGPTCSNLIQLGTKGGDGYKYMCLPADNRTDASAATKSKECHIISVGGNDNWKFEVAAADQLGCIIHTFDCTLPDGISQTQTTARRHSLLQLLYRRRVSLRFPRSTISYLW